MTRGEWVAISQRQVTFPHRSETGDYLDREWYGLEAFRGRRLLAVPNSLDAARRTLSGLHLAAVVLTGGNDVPSAPEPQDLAPGRDAVESWLLDRAEAQGTPVIGVCRGAQLIASRCGARLVDGGHAHAGTRHLVRAVGVAPWRWPETFTVASHHRWALPAVGLPERLRPLALAPDDTVEAFAHRDRPWWGLMWHPEREFPAGPAADALTHLLNHRDGLSVRPNQKEHTA
ncbi:gamma-glutamyl-gamma-aminobutyrate hydrolase family protein [Streptomyces sp. ISL-22]|uniref:gamma-glutamyl-gamma-aminobutyrate hydrolase family protein n=1 Tax=unclassified Streptomyces TaxID=2593676 RepID=UPI001BE79E5A|nr:MULTISPECIES: gamma-glutamyl-gamma-aminobutyrate hydrolase family protein [unclassified Streptomyces]MBT2417996.1 gamma-glutamyl-gamma-aminobutyrate hydrolase family protein [Streptomyces sp. ISL-24]MBT2432329.1 gamma-glutamyl-gamma-aminobutyrate hydrolase family protein [Streptomyces sp. ISL-22]